MSSYSSQINKQGQVRNYFTTAKNVVTFPFRVVEGTGEFIANFVGNERSPMKLWLLLAGVPALMSGATTFLTYLDPSILYDVKTPKERLLQEALEIGSKGEKRKPKKEKENKEEKEVKEESDDSEEGEEQLKIGTVAELLGQLAFGPIFHTKRTIFSVGASEMLKNMTPFKKLTEKYVENIATKSKEDYERELVETLALSQILKKDIELKDLKALDKKTVASIVKKLSERTGLKKEELIKEIYGEEEDEIDREIKKSNAAIWFIGVPLALLGSGAVFTTNLYHMFSNYPLTVSTDTYKGMLERLDIKGLPKIYEEMLVPREDIFTAVSELEKAVLSERKPEKKLTNLDKKIMKKMKSSDISSEDKDEERIQRLISKIEKQRQSLVKKELKGK